MSSDFAHRLTLDRIRDGERLDLTADAAECARIAERLALVALDRFDAHVALGREGDEIRATGRIKAASPAASRSQPASTRRSICGSSPSPRSATRRWN
jgi:hypothetical protein